MSLHDDHGLAVSTTSRPALEGYGRALALFNAFRADPFAEIEATLAETPDFAMGHALRAGLLAMSTERALMPEALRSVATIEAMGTRANDRERAHAAAARAWCQGDFAGGRDRYGAIAATWPRDLLALQLAHQADFFTGARQALRDRPTAALPAWSSREPGSGFLLGMRAFGLEECGEYAAAEQAGRHAVEREAGDAWAIHAVAHVLEMQGRTAEGVEWLAGRNADWAPDNMLAVHNWWHLALFHLDRGDHAAALAVFDDGVRRRGPAPAVELLDAAAMLWRFMLAGIDCGPRWAEAADGWSGQEPGFYAFNDCHAVMACLGAGRHAEAHRLLAVLRTTAAGQGTGAMMAREVGLPLAEGLVAFAEGDYADASSLLAPLPPVAHRFGGSHAQRDVIALTRLEAAVRAGERATAAGLAAERLRGRPESALARGLATRAMARAA